MRPATIPSQTGEGGKVRRPGRQTVPRDKGRGCHHDALQSAQATMHQAGIAERSHTDSHVDLIVDQAFAVVGQAHFKGQLGVPFKKPRYDGGDAIKPERNRHGHAQQPVDLRVADLPIGFRRLNSNRNRTRASVTKTLQHAEKL